MENSPFSFSSVPLSGVPIPAIDLSRIQPCPSKSYLSCKNRCRSGGACSCRTRRVGTADPEMRAGADLVQGAVVGSGTATEAVVVREADGNNRSQPPPPSLPLSVWPCETSMTSAGVRRGFVVLLQGSCRCHSKLVCLQEEHQSDVALGTLEKLNQ